MDNAANKIDVQVKGRRVKARRQREMNDLRQVLSTPEGRRFLWRLMSECGAFASVVRSGLDSSVFYLSGKQDVGHFIQAEVIEANEGAYLTMQKESWANVRKDALEEEAETEARKAVIDDQGKGEL